MISAIFKVVPGYDGRKDNLAIIDTMNYINDHPITNGVYCLGCSNKIDDAVDQFMKTKEIFGKNDGVMCRHYVLSFSENEKITMDTVIRLAYETACFFWNNGFQVYYGIHSNNTNGGFHIHYCVNSVNIFDGKKIPINADFKHAFMAFVKRIDFLGERIYVNESNSYV